MRVGQVTDSVSRQAGGVQEALRGLALATEGLGVQNIVLTGHDKYTEDDSTLWNGVTLLSFPVVGPRAFSFAPKLARSIREQRLDLLHVHGIWMYPSVATLLVARRTGLPYIISPHGMLHGWALKHSRWKKVLAALLYERAHLRRAACLRALSEAELASFRAYGLRNPVCVVPNGVYLPGERRPLVPTWAAHLPDQMLVLLYLGRLHVTKGLPNLVRGWAAVPDTKRKDWRLVVAGWDQGGQEAKLRRLARELGVEATVEFAGPQFGDDKEASLVRADAFVLPSFSEGLPGAVLEAWAYGLPVVMTPQCNLPEGFAGGAALRVNPEPASIARGLEQLFEMSDAERRRMGERGRRLVEEKFSWPQIARQMKEVYEWVLSGGPKPACVRTD